MTQTEPQESPKLREARKELSDAYELEGFYIGTRIEDIRERNGRIYYDKWARFSGGRWDVTIHRYDGIGDHDVDTANGLRAQQYEKGAEVGAVFNGVTEWDDEQAEADHTGER